MAGKSNVPKACPICGVEGTLIKVKGGYHCKDKDCGASFPGRYLAEKQKALKRAEQTEAEG